MKHLKKFENINNDDIFYAIDTENLNRVKELIKSGIYIDSRHNNCTPLYYATLHDCNEIVIELIKSGANVNFQDTHGYTSLILSTSYDNLEITKELIKAGADWNIKEENNKDFLDYLSYDEKQDLIKLYPKKYEEYLLKKETENYNI